MRNWGGRLTQSLQDLPAHRNLDGSAQLLGRRHVAEGPRAVAGLQVDLRQLTMRAAVVRIEFQNGQVGTDCVRRRALCLVRPASLKKRVCLQLLVVGEVGKFFPSSARLSSRSA